MGKQRFIRIAGTSRGREASVTFDGDRLTGDAQVIEAIEQLVTSRAPILMPSSATLDLDEGLLTRATMMRPFDAGATVSSHGVSMRDDTPTGAIN